MPTESQLRSIFDALGDGVFVASAAGVYLDANPAGCQMMGHARADLLRLRMPDLLDPSEHPRLAATLPLFAQGLRREEWLFRRGDGRTFVGELVGSQLPDGRYQSVVRDMSDRHARDRQEQILRGEAMHRTKNILAIVQAVVRQSAAASPAAFIPAFEERLAALAASHRLFADHEWSAIGLAELIAVQMAPFATPGGGRLALDGPVVELGPGAAQSIGMALHELATNAAKYGALSAPGGRVRIAWRLAPDGGFELDWRETGGPPALPPQQRGFGSRMIEQMIERALGAATRLDWGPGGLGWTMRCDAAALART